MRIKSVIALGVVALGAIHSSFALDSPDWSEGTEVTAPRSNPYQFHPSNFEMNRREGYLHALEYPLSISGVLVPWRPTEAFLNHPSPNPLRALLQTAFAGFTHIKSSDDLFARVGLHTYPTTEAEGSRDIPTRESTPPPVRMGVTLIDHQGTQALTLSCAACHSSNLFGKKILGMTNRFPRANEFFVLGKKVVSLTSPFLFSEVLVPTPSEVDLFKRLRSRVPFIGSRMPTTLGLDTSLAQVALSLARRGGDEYAELNPENAKHPRPELLTKFVSDSKPAVWWNLKYKNRWLSDGSVVSGNPIYTNILWNEIGRGTDLHELERWFAENQKVIENLTTAAFSTEAPHITDFFPAERVSIERAKRGETHFNQACARCHGTYSKNWSRSDADSLPLVEQLKTSVVRYPSRTKVMNIGTDPQRAMGMSSLERGLNPLAISRQNGIVIKAQNGYVPPPLVGIWARYPYFHNNSIPSLCAMLTAGASRPKSYWAGEAIDRNRDYDFDCGGYPVDAGVPGEWKNDPAYLYDTTRPGLANTGHDEGIFLKNGVDVFNPEEKRELIEFLKTL